MEAARARELLDERKRELQALARTATEQGDLDSAQGDSGGGELSNADQHPADAATDTLEREMDVSLREDAEGRLRDIDRALERIDSGTYGMCTVCERPIPDDRLEVRPEAEFCVEHTPS